MDDPIFKQKYQKYKLRVKLWEKDFKKKNGRPPSKFDIREAPQEIRDSYKMYYKLKTSFLEDTLNDVLLDDGFDVSEICQETEGALLQNEAETNNGLKAQLPIDISSLMNGLDSGNTESESCKMFSNLAELTSPRAISNVVNVNENQVLRSFEAVTESPLNENAWGSNVSNVGKSDQLKSAKKNPMDKNRMIKSNLSEKLFKSASFSKRNPRKSLSRNNLDGSMQSTSTTLNNNNDVEQREILPDLETILTLKAKEQQSAAAVAANPLLAGSNSKEIIKIKLDEGWLNRTSCENSLKPTIARQTASPAMKDETQRSRTYGLSNLDVTKILPMAETRSTRPEDPKTDIKTIEDPLVSSAKVEESQFGKEHIGAGAEDRGEASKAKANFSEDSVVSDSEGENDSQEYRHIAKRRRTVATIRQKSETFAVRTPNEIEDNSLKIDTKRHNEDNNGQDPADEKLAAPVVRRKTKTVPKERKKEKNPKTASKTTKKAAPKARRAPSRSCKKPSESTAPNGSNDEDENDKALDPEDLKYALALESVELTSAPRIRMSDLEVVDNVAKDYINTVILPNNAKVDGPVNEKREAARKKLEEKIASGRLNENFVTINIQKKVFARGKKAMSYSKYKKKVWKDKKRVAALCGPDMDMRGCEGGVLKCFTCGQPGHFAQNCKVKGDALMPLSAEAQIDESPFPTLEEAEKMATQNALSVHSRNITRMPAAKNTAMYQSNDDQEKVSGSDEKTIKALETETETDDDSNEEGNDGAMIMNSDDEIEDMDLDAAITNFEHSKVVSPIKQFVGHKIPEDFLRAAGLDVRSSGSVQEHLGSVDALYALNDDGSVKDTTPEVMEALHLFGHSNFRKGQDRAIMRILSGLSTLVTLSTGSGKSLCYQLPAYLFSRKKKSITLVISPLVSLMEDQVTGVPHFLRAHCLHTNQTPQQRLKIMQTIADGEIDILLVSPEAVVAGERSTGFGAILRQLPPIAFACIDEAHCVSQWSHNFRPSYLMICKVLRKNLGVRTVLGLTATATLPTRLSIIEHLGITDGGNGIISDIPLPDNLILSVSKDDNKDAALLALLLSKRFDSCQSIIIYCTRRDECERISAFLRTSFQDHKANLPDSGDNGGKRKRKRINWHAEPYHAGMPASRRRTIQNAFMSNELRIVVATIAFGMGINKPDIRAVIHYNMPRNFESYVQEIGRAGRDGKLSHCHLFLDSQGNDQNELRRHIYANSIDRHVIRKLLQRVFVPCSCDNSNGSEHIPRSSNRRICPGHEIGFSIDETVEALDIPAENISTLLCYMELDTRWHINVLSSAYIMAKVVSYGGPKYLKHAAKNCAPLAMAIALGIKNKKFDENSNIFEFSVVDIAAAIGWNSGVVKYQLKNLEWTEVNGRPRRSPINVNFYSLGFRLKAPGDFTDEEIDEALDTLYNRSVKQEHTQLIQLQYVFQGLSSVAYNTYVPCSKETFSYERSDQLKAIIRDYFQNDYPKDMKLEVNPSPVPDDSIINDIHSLINVYPDNNFSGRNIARIFHGISSPNYPALMWSRCNYWRAHSKTDFNHLVQLANAVIVKRRT